MYLDTNGDGVSSAADIIQPVGTTTLDVYLRTDADRAGDPAVCGVDQTLPTSINRYTFVLKAVGGTVQWGPVTNWMPFPISMGSTSSPTELFAGFAGLSDQPPDQYRLARVTLTATTGTPGIVIAPSTSLPGDRTGFGSLCPGAEYDQFLKLGVDWFDTDGAGGPGNSAPAIAQLFGMAVTEGMTASQSVTANDADGNWIQLSKASGPDFMTVSTVASEAGSASGTIRLTPSFDDAGAYTGGVAAGDGFVTATHSFSIRVFDSRSSPFLGPRYDMQVGAGQRSVQTLSAHDADGEAAQVSFELVAGPTYASTATLQPADAFTSLGEIRLAPSAADAGPATATVAAVKDELRDEVSIAITVLANPSENQTPRMEPLADIRLLPGVPRGQFLNASDPDAGSLTARKVYGPDFVRLDAIVSPGQVSGRVLLAPSSKDLGTWPVMIGVSDGYVEAQEPFTATVVATGEPIFTDIGDIVVGAGMVDRRIVRAIDPDTPYLVFSKVSGPDYLSVLSEPSFEYSSYGVLVLTPTLADIGVASAVISVSDGANTTSATIEISVLRPCPVMLPARLDAPESPRKSLLGDIDGDRIPDLVAFSQPTKDAWVCHGAGDGTFGTSVPFATSNRMLEASLSDVNGDGKQDLAYGDSNNAIHVRLADGTGGFGPDHDLLYHAGYLESILAADLDGDGDQDFLAGYWDYPQRIAAFLGSGDGTFAAGPVTEVPATAQFVTADFNGDGQSDVAMGTGQSVTVLPGLGTGAFGSPTTYPVTGFIQHVAAGDLDRDGRPDLVGVGTTDQYSSSGTATVWINDAAGGFRSPKAVASPTVILFPVIADVTGDGRADVVGGGALAVVFPGLQGGALGVPTATRLGNSVIDLAVADLNGDGRLDWIGTELNVASNVYLNLGCGAASDQTPVVLAPGIRNGVENVPLSFTVYAADPDAEPISSLGANELPEGAVFSAASDGASGIVEWTPGWDQAGEHPVTFRAVNSLTGSASTRIQVANSDRAPIVTAPFSRVACAGALIQFEVSASDPDGEPIASLTASPLPPGATFAADPGNASGAFVWTTDPGSAGTYEISFQANNELTTTVKTLIVIESSTACPIAFTLESPDTVGAVGTQSSLRLDAFGNPHVVYTTTGQPGLRYAHLSGSSWVIETIPNPSSSAGGVSLALDGSGEPVVTYVAFEPIDPGYYQYRVKLARRVAGSWSFETVAVVGPSTHIAPVAFGPEGILHVAYHRFAQDFDIVYASRGATGWSIESVHRATDGVGDLSLVFDGQGRPHMAWREQQAVVHAVREPTGWGLDLQAPAASLSLAVDALGRAHMASISWSPYTLQHHVLQDGVWQIEPVAAFDPGLYRGICLQVDRNGMPLIAYHEAAEGRLNLAWKGALGWRRQLVDAGEVGRNPSLALADGLHPRITYLDAAHFDLRYASGVMPPPNRPPAADARGPYAGTIGQAIQFDASGSSDPDGDALTFVWNFGDGSEGSGVAPQHHYAAPAVFSVALTASDGDLTGTAEATATITEALEARAFVIGAARSVPLVRAAQPALCVLLEPVGAAYGNDDLDVTTVVMRSDSTGDVNEIPAQAGRTAFVADRDRNGVEEISVCFARDGLSAIFSDLTGRTQILVSIEGSLQSGARVHATLRLTVVPTGAALAALSYPNPLNPSGTLGVVTSRVGRLRVQMFDVGGRLVRSLLDDPRAGAGFREIPIDGRDGQGRRLASGVYFYRVESDEGTLTGRITIAK